MVSSSLMLDLVEDGVGGEVRGAASTDLKQERGYIFIALFYRDKMMMPDLARRE